MLGATESRVRASPRTVRTLYIESATSNEQEMSAMDDTERKNKNNAAYGETVEDLQRVVRARKYRFCAAEYSQLAEGENDMPKVRDRYLKIAQYYRELAEAEAAGSAGSEDPEAAPRGPAAPDQQR